MIKSLLTQCKVHPATWFMVIVLLLNGQWQTLLAYAAALISHETAHIIAAKRKGCTVASMELTPFGAVARIEDLQAITPKEQGFIAAMGPAASLSGVVFGYLTLRWVPRGMLALAMLSIKANLVLLLVNLLPALPLDGGRIILAVASSRWGAQRCARILCNIGMWMGAAMSCLALYVAVKWNVYHLSLILTGCYLAYAAAQCAKTFSAHAIHTLIQKRIHLEKRGALEVYELAVSSKCSIRRFQQMMPAGKYCRAIVVDPNYFKPLATLDEDQLIDALLTDMNMTMEQACGLSKQG